MREYAKVSPKFWTGTTGKALRRRGPEALIVAVYLMTAPGSNMLGLYYQPTLYMAHETGLGIEGASKGLRDCIEEGFCKFDEATEMVWVVEMASYQVAEELKAKDKRCAGIQKDYDTLPINPFLAEFFDRYSAPFHLSKKRDSDSIPEAPAYAPSKPHRSKEQEQEQEQEQEIETANAVLSPDAPTTPLPTPTLTLIGEEEVSTEIPPCPHRRLLAAFAERVPELPQPRRELWEGGKGAEAMRTRWKWLLTATREDGERYATTAEEGIEWMSKFFDQVAASDFLTGRDGKWRGCDLTWLMNRENFAKVIQGNYVRQAA